VRVSCGCSEERGKASRANKVVAEALGAASTAAKASAKEIRRGGDTPSNVASTRRRGGKRRPSPCQRLSHVQTRFDDQPFPSSDHSQGLSSLAPEPPSPGISGRATRAGMAWNGRRTLIYALCSPSDSTLLGSLLHLSSLLSPLPLPFPSDSSFLFIFQFSIHFNS
jgi:hypothetical protein